MVNAQEQRRWVQPYLFLGIGQFGHCVVKRLLRELVLHEPVLLNIHRFVAITDPSSGSWWKDEVVDLASSRTRELLREFHVSDFQRQEGTVGGATGGAPSGKSAGANPSQGAQSALDKIIEQQLVPPDPATIPGFRLCQPPQGGPRIHVTFLFYDVDEKDGSWKDLASYLLEHFYDPSWKTPTQNRLCAFLRFKQGAESEVLALWNTKAFQTAETENACYIASGQIPGGEKPYPDVDSLAWYVVRVLHPILHAGHTVLSDAIGVTRLFPSGGSRMRCATEHSLGAPVMDMVGRFYSRCLEKFVADFLAVEDREAALARAKSLVKDGRAEFIKYFGEKKGLDKVPQPSPRFSVPEPWGVPNNQLDSLQSQIVSFEVELEQYRDELGIRCRRIHASYAKNAREYRLKLLEMLEKELKQRRIDTFGQFAFNLYLIAELEDAWFGEGGHWEEHRRKLRLKEFLSRQFEPERYYLEIGRCLFLKRPKLQAIPLHAMPPGVMMGAVASGSFWKNPLMIAGTFAGGVVVSAIGTLGLRSYIRRRFENLLMRDEKALTNHGSHAAAELSQNFEHLAVNMREMWYLRILNGVGRFLRRILTSHRTLKRRLEALGGVTDPTSYKFPQADQVDALARECFEPTMLSELVSAAGVTGTGTAEPIDAEAFLEELHIWIESRCKKLLERNWLADHRSARKFCDGMVGKLAPVHVPYEENPAVLFCASDYRGAVGDQQNPPAHFFELPHLNRITLLRFNDIEASEKSIGSDEPTESEEG